MGVDFDLIVTGIVTGISGYVMSGLHCTESARIVTRLAQEHAWLLYPNCTSLRVFFVVFRLFQMQLWSCSIRKPWQNLRPSLLECVAETHLLNRTQQNNKTLSACKALHK